MGDPHPQKNGAENGYSSHTYSLVQRGGEKFWVSSTSTTIRALQPPISSDEATSEPDQRAIITAPICS